MFTKKFSCALIVILLAFGILFTNSMITNLRKNNELVFKHYNPSESVPILLLGGFRAIAIDLLWIRGIARHQEKKYYETMAINNLIAKLQPDFPSVWTFQAWNMAYNIAHEWKAFENKWKWIKAGIEFAKRGAVKNQANADIAFELGYMYLHLFNRKVFKHADYCRTKLREELNEDNFEEAAFWLKKAVLFKSKNFNASVMQRMICHAYWQAALQAEKDRRLDNALEYTKKTIAEWNVYLDIYPEDPQDMAKKFMPMIEQKKDEILQILTNN